MTPLERAIYHVIAAWGQIGVHIPNDRHWASVRGHEYLDDSMGDLIAAVGQDRLQEIVTIVLTEEDAEDAVSDGGGRVGGDHG